MISNSVFFILPPPPPPQPSPNPPCFSFLLHSFCAPVCVVYVCLRFYGCIFVDLVRHGVLTRVSEIPCCKNDHYYYYYYYLFFRSLSVFRVCWLHSRGEGRVSETLMQKGPDRAAHPVVSSTPCSEQHTLY